MSPGKRPTIHGRGVVSFPDPLAFESEAENLSRLGLPGVGNRKGAVKGPSLPGDVSRGSAKSQHAPHSRQERVLAIDE